MNTTEKIKMIAVVFIAVTALFFGESCAKGISDKPVYTIDEVKPGEWEYTVFSENGRELLRGTAFRLPPELTQTDTGLVQIAVSAGTGTMYYNYVDTQKELVSDTFLNVVLTDNGRTVYLEQQDDGIDLVVQEIFGTSAAAVRFRRDFAEFITLSGIVKFAEFRDNAHLYAEYYLADGGSVTQEIFDIEEPNSELPESNLNLFPAVDERGRELPRLNLQENNPIDAYFEQLESEIDGDTISLTEWGSAYAAAWKSELEHDYDVLSGKVRPGAQEVAERLEGSRTAFMEYVPDAAYLYAYAEHSDALLDADYTEPDAPVLRGTITPLAAEMYCVEKYRERTFELLDILYGIDEAYEFAFTG